MQNSVLFNLDFMRILHSIRFSAIGGLAASVAVGLVPLPGSAAEPQAPRSRLQWERVPIKPLLVNDTPTGQPLAKGELLAAVQEPSPSKSASVAAPVDVEQLRRELLIAPVVVGASYSAPSLSPGVPSAFIAGWGDYFISASGSTPGARPDVDGGLSVGFGLGDAAKAVALELDLNITSFKNFGQTGGFDAKLGRIVVNKPSFRLGASVGVVNVATWDTGDDGANPDPSVYGVVTAAWPLRPNNMSFKQTMQVSAGAGGETWGYDNADAGGFASFGVEVLPNLGVAAGWSGRGVNAGLSFVPFKRTPLTVSLQAGDIFDQTANGPVGVLSISWGSNFRTAQF